MFKAKAINVAEAEEAMRVLKESVHGHAGRSREVKAAISKVKAAAEHRSSAVDTSRLYHAVRHTFIVEAAWELKLKTVKDSAALRSALMEKPALKSEEELIHLLTACLKKAEFPPLEIIRFYRAAERNLMGKPEMVSTATNPLELSILHQSNGFVVSGSDRLQAYPEDRVMVDVTPNALHYRAHHLGIVGPELMNMNQLVEEFVSKQV